MNQRSKRLVGVGGKTNALTGGVFIYGMFSLFFLGWSAVVYYRSAQLDFPSLGLGLLFGIVAAFAHRRAKQFNIHC
jgi:hypothetical protein